MIKKITRDKGIGGLAGTWSGACTITCTGFEILSVVEIRKNILLVETGGLCVSKETGWCTKYRKSEHNLCRSYERFVRLSGTEFRKSCAFHAAGL